MTLKEQIKLLIDLQVIDKEIYELETEKSSFPDRIKNINESLEMKKTGIKQAEENLKNVQVKLKDREVSMQQKEEQIGKLQGQLYQLKTNKEYSTMLKEIEGIKADNSVAEEEMIKLMDDIESAKKKIQEEKDIFRKEEEDSNKEKQIVASKEKEIDVKLSGLSSQRNEAAMKIEKQLLARYEKVLKNKEGVAIVPVESSACGGCHMGLPPQTVSEAKLKENLVVCGNCNRILYVGDDVEID